MLLLNTPPPEITSHITLVLAVAVVTVMFPSDSQLAISGPASTVGAATKFTLFVKVCSWVHGEIA